MNKLTLVSFGMRVSPVSNTYMYSIKPFEFTLAFVRITSANAILPLSSFQVITALGGSLFNELFVSQRDVNIERSMCLEIRFGRSLNINTLSLVFKVNVVLVAVPSAAVWAANQETFGVTFFLNTSYNTILVSITLIIIKEIIIIYLVFHLLSRIINCKT